MQTIQSLLIFMMIGLKSNNFSNSINKKVLLMSTLHKNKSINLLLSLTLASAIVTLSGCGGGGGSKKAADVSGVTEVKLKKSLKEGLTKGLDSNVETMSSTFETVSDSFGNSSSTPKYLAGVSASNNAVGGLNTATDDIVDKFNVLIDNSTSTNSGSVYTFDPDENTICADPLFNNNTPAKIADCASVLSNISFTSTITAVNSNNEVTAADTDFKYNTSTFSKLGFSSGNSAYYEVVLGGMSALLARINTIAGPADQIDIPDSMSGSLRIASSAQTSTSGTLTLSVPSTISVSDVSPATNINIGQTNSLFSVTADSTANTMNLNIGLSALDILFTGEDDQGNTYPQRLLIGALSGQAVVSNNGNTMTLTGITANGVQLKIDGTQALLASLTSLDATMTSANNNTQKIITLNSALDFDLALTNVRHFLDDDDPVTNTVSFNIDAPAGTATQNVAGNELIKVTHGSITAVSASTGSATNTASVTVGNCLNTDDYSLDNSANCQ